jgi:hypothetical protein
MLLYKHFVVMNDPNTMIQTTDEFQTLFTSDPNKAQLVYTTYGPGHHFKYPWEKVHLDAIENLDTTSLDYTYGSKEKGKKNSVRTYRSTVFVAWEATMRPYIVNAVQYFQNGPGTVKSTLSRNFQACNASLFSHLSDMDCSRNLSVLSEMVMWCFRPPQEPYQKEKPVTPELTNTEESQLNSLIGKLTIDLSDEEYRPKVTEEQIRGLIKKTLQNLRHSFYSTFLDLGVIVESYQLYDLDLPKRRQLAETNRGNVAELRYQTALLLGLVDDTDDWNTKLQTMWAKEENQEMMLDTMRFVAQTLELPGFFTVSSKGGKGGRGDTNPAFAAAMLGGQNQ